MSGDTAPAAWRPSVIASVGFLLSPAPAAVLLAWNHARLGGSDRDQAWALALTTVVLHFLMILLLPVVWWTWVVVALMNLGAAFAAIALQDRRYRAFLKSGGRRARTLSAVAVALGVVGLELLALVGISLIPWPVMGMP